MITNQNNGDALLVLQNVSKRFGGLMALSNLNCDIPRKKIVALIGPNGAGKTTLFNTISGVYRPTTGSVVFDSVDISGMRPHAICKMGIARTFQIVRPFLKMTSLENVMVGSMFGTERGTGFKEAAEKGKELLEFVGLADRMNTPTANLTLVNRKKVELAKALASNPKLVLLDEILAGLNPTEVEAAMDLIKKIRDSLGVTVFWVEHVMDAVINLAEHIVVLNYGEKIAEETPKGLLSNQTVIDAYLGEDYIF